MRLGLVARNDCSGLGVQTYEMFAHLHPAKTLVVDVSDMYDKGDHCNKRQVFEYPGAQVVHGWHPTDEEINEFLDGVDVVYSAETFYSWELVRAARERGVRTVLHVNPEFCDHLVSPGLPAPDLFAAPTTWLYDRLPQPKTLLPVPVATERFTTRHNGAQARNFLHVVGRPAIHDRNGTVAVLRALAHVRSPVAVTVRCLQPGHVAGLARRARVPRHVELVIDDGDVDDYWDLYDGQDVLLAPRRFGGMSLPVQEALGAGMPAVIGAHDPYAGELPRDWQVPSRPAGRFMTRTWVDVYDVDPGSLAAKIDGFAIDAQFIGDSRIEAARLAGQRSWGALLPRYREVLAGLEAPADI